MKNDIEKVLNIVSDSEQLIRDDALAKEIESRNDELSEDELDLVMAAAKPDYQKFIARLNRDKKQ